MSDAEEEQALHAVEYIASNEHWLGRMEAFIDCAVVTCVAVAGAVAFSIAYGAAMWRTTALLALEVLGVGLTRWLRLRVIQRRAEIDAFLEKELGHE